MPPTQWRLRSRRFAASVAVASVAACQLFFPTEEQGAGDAQVPDGRAAGSESGGDSPADAGPYHDMSSTAYWSLYDIGKNSPSFTGGVFDGRYVYLSPWFGAMQRYDTHAPFGARSSWSAFDTGTLTETSFNVYSGAAFDGRYVYLIPYNDGYVEHIVFFRYDTLADFASAGSYSQFDATLLLDKTVEGYSGSAFDGRYIYFVPDVTGLAARYDTRAPFTAASSWERFDIASVRSGATGLEGAIFDGRYVYFIPNTNNDAPADGGSYTGCPDGILARYDTHGPFGDKASWSTFDTTSLGPEALGFAGGAFDGRYVYLAPLYSPLGVVVRYDSQRAFDKLSSWSTFTANTVDPHLNGFFGGAFDGRFVYMVPNQSFTYSGVVGRYDTQAPFGNAGAWQAFDMESKLSSQAYGFSGAVFDGQYLYFVPTNGSVVPRFDARSPGAMPKLPGFYGSFF